jgi:hypothetical protein
LGAVPSAESAILHPILRTGLFDSVSAEILLVAKVSRARRRIGGENCRGFAAALLEGSNHDDGKGTTGRVRLLTHKVTCFNNAELLESF